MNPILVADSFLHTYVEQNDRITTLLEETF